MRLLQPTRPREETFDDGGRRERAGTGRPAGVRPAPARPDGLAYLTSRQLMAVVRERLAARGFDWGDALPTMRQPSPAEPEETR